MEELDLSRNDFSGKIPVYLEGFVFLLKLNLSFNDFVGAVPKKKAFLRMLQLFLLRGTTSFVGVCPNYICAVATPNSSQGEDLLIA